MNSNELEVSEQSIKTCPWKIWLNQGMYHLACVFIVSRGGDNTEIEDLTDVSVLKAKQDCCGALCHSYSLQRYSIPRAMFQERLGHRYAC